MTNWIWIFLIVVLVLIWRIRETKNRLAAKREIINEISIQGDVQLKLFQTFIESQKEQILLGQENAQLLEVINARLFGEEEMKLTKAEGIKLMADINYTQALNDTIEVTTDGE